MSVAASRNGGSVQDPVEGLSVLAIPLLPPFVPPNMARLVALFIAGGLLVAASNPVNAQSERDYGLAVGYNRATMQSPAELSMHSAFSIGVVARQPLLGRVSLQSELLLNQKGAEVEGDDGGGIAYGVGYLELPLLLHAATPRFHSVTIYGEAGGYGSLKIFERLTSASGELNISLRTGTSFYRRVDAGALVGLGATVPFGERRLSFIVRREWGLVDVARDVERQPFPEVAFPEAGENRAWSLQFRFGF